MRTLDIKRSQEVEGATQANSQRLGKFGVVYLEVTISKIVVGIWKLGGKPDHTAS